MINQIPKRRHAKRKKPWQLQRRLLNPDEVESFYHGWFGSGEWQAVGRYAKEKDAEQGMRDRGRNDAKDFRGVRFGWRVVDTTEENK